MTDKLQAGNQPVISQILIGCIMTTFLIYVGSTPLNNKRSLLLMVWVFPVLSLLTLSYALTYRTKASWIMLAIFLGMSLILYLIFAFIQGMGAMFHNN